MDEGTRGRVRYAKSPLTNVIAQITFPPLLSISERAPVEFQEILREAYPFFETRESLASIFGSPGVAVQQSEPRIFDFYNQDRSYQITLSPDFYAAASTRYEGWTTFRRVVADGLQAMLECYKPVLFLRFGLRYINEIDVAAMGIGDAKLADLVDGRAFGLASVFSDNCRQHQSVTLLQLDATLKANLRLGLNYAEDGRLDRIRVDCDVFTEDQLKADFDGAVGRFDHLHEQASRLFRWIIKGRAHEAFEPIPGTEC